MELLTSLVVIFIIQGKKAKVAVHQLCPTLCEPKDYNLLGSSRHRIFQTQILEWVAIPFSKGCS